MTKDEVIQAVQSLQANGWVIVEVYALHKGGYVVIAADTVDDHVTYETLTHAQEAGTA
jgi:hypothetical protein